MTMKKELTTKQQSFLDNLIECGGDAKRAAELAGYAEGSYVAVVRALKSEILELTTNMLAFNAPKAAQSIINMVTSTEPVPQANIRLQAAQTLLDRVGVTKTDKLEVETKGGGGIFILPAKRQTEIIDGDYSEAQD